MKIEGAKKIQYDSGPNMTPLVDIVMVILIFLMLAGSFGLASHYLISDTPIEEKGGGDYAPPAGSVMKVQLRVTIEQGPEGYYRVTMPNMEKVDDGPSAHGSAYQKMYSEFCAHYKTFKDNGTDPETVQVILAAGATVKLENLLLVYQAALTSGFKKVGFGTL